MEYAIGVDIGNTKISFVLSEGGRLVSSQIILTPKNKKEVVKIIKENIHKFKKEIGKQKIEGVGIGIAGPLNKERTLILNPPNLRILANFPLAKIVEKESGIKTIMENDVKCFTLAEAIMGAGKGYDSVLGLTLGSGIGGGFVFKDTGGKIRIYKGIFGGAGEVGHMTIKMDGEKCSCGNLGCFENYASEKFFDIPPLEMEKRAKKGEQYAKTVYQEFGRNLGVGLANLINILDPEIVVIGGGIAKAWPLFLNAAKSEIKKRVLSIESKKSVKIKISKLGDLAGAIGAALLLENYD